MTFEGEQSAETAEIPDFRLIETSRVLVLKKDHRGGYKALFCENLDSDPKKGKDPEKRGKYELPGGKLYETAYAKGLYFDHQPEPHKESVRLRTAVKELEQETGMYIHKGRLTHVSTEMTEITNGRHPDFPEATHRKTNIYVVILQDKEYREIPENHAANLENDDKHRDVVWIDDFDVESLVGSDLDDLIARNSKISPEAGAKINQIATTTKESVQSQIIPLSQSQNMIVRANGVLMETKFSRSRSFGGEKISSVDFNHEPPLGKAAFFESFKTQFGKELNNEVIDAFVVPIMTQYCAPYLVDRAKFLGEPLKRDRVSPGEYYERLEHNIAALARKVKSPTDLYELYCRANSSQQGRRFLRAFFGFGKISGLDYFSHIEPNQAAFENSLLKTLTDPHVRTGRPKKDEKGRYQTTMLNGQKCFLELDSNVKSLDRMAGKATTKAEVDPDQIKDVYRARIVVEDETDLSGIVTALEKKFGKKGGRTPGSWKLEIDEDDDSNINRDAEREEIKVKGRYPIFASEGIPVEFMIMTRQSYEKNESGPKHHNVYVAIQTLVEECRPTDGINVGSYHHVINTLVNDPQILQSYPHYSPERHEAIRRKARADIVARFDQYFFRHEGHYYAFQHILRLRNTPDFAQREDELFLAMILEANEKSGCILTANEWKNAFDHPHSISPVTLIKKCGANLNRFIEVIAHTKWSTDIRPEIIERIIFDYLTKAIKIDPHIAMVLSSLIFYGSDQLSNAEEQVIRKHKGTIRSIIDQFHDNRRFHIFLDSL